MTMRQVKGLLKIINKADLVEFYNQLLSYGTIHGAKLPSLPEFLSLTSGKGQKDVNGFDEETDKFLEAKARELLEERRLKNVK